MIQQLQDRVFYTYEMENDWMSWKFAVESKQYWLNIHKR